MSRHEVSVHCSGANSVGYLLQYTSITLCLFGRRVWAMAFNRGVYVSIIENYAQSALHFLKGQLLRFQGQSASHKNLAIRVAKNAANLFSTGRR